VSPTFKSGAFIQQCFASHRLSLSLKKLALPDKMVLTCNACHLHHRLTVRAFTIHTPAGIHAPSVEMAENRQEPGELLARCVTAHSAALGVRAMDVVRDSAGLRCAECRRAYDLDVSAFETDLP
jgi:hypothetical protein